MGAWESGLWGLAGGAGAGLLSLMTAVVNNGFQWWDARERGPRLFVFCCSLLLGAGVASAAGSEMSGAWPAFVIGAGAPATIRGLLSGVQVGPRLEIDRRRSVEPDQTNAEPLRSEEKTEASKNVR